MLGLLIGCGDPDVSECSNESVGKTQKRFEACYRGCMKTDDKGACAQRTVLAADLCKASGKIDKSLDIEPCHYACRENFEFACQLERESR